MNEVFSESSFLKKLFPLLATNKRVSVPVGDDCAVFDCGEKQIVIGVDQLVESKHYLAGTDATLAGKKLLARNLSDIAAMGAKPTFAVISVAVSPDKSEEWLLGFHRGVVQEAEKFGVLLIGGDLAQTPQDNVASLTLLGELSKDEKPALRSGARSGDILYATGEFGFSFETEHHLTFSPRVNEGRWLRSRVKALMDVTDGLLIDSSRMAMSSKVNLILNVDDIPARTFLDQPADIKRRLTDGEDYELIMAVAPEDEKTFLKDWPFDLALTRIGQFSGGQAGRVIDSTGNELCEIYGTGFDHFNK